MELKIDSVYYGDEFRRWYGRDISLPEYKNVSFPKELHKILDLIFDKG